MPVAVVIDRDRQRAALRRSGGDLDDTGLRVAELDRVGDQVLQDGPQVGGRGQHDGVRRQRRRSTVALRSPISSRGRQRRASPPA